MATNPTNVRVNGIDPVGLTGSQPFPEPPGSDPVITTTARLNELINILLEDASNMMHPSKLPLVSADLTAYLRRYEKAYGQTPTVRHLAEHFNVAASTMYRWLRRIRA